VEVAKTSPNPGQHRNLAGHWRPFEERMEPGFNEDNRSQKEFAPLSKAAVSELLSASAAIGFTLLPFDKSGAPADSGLHLYMSCS
jgi:hypothetical protein